MRKGSCGFRNRHWQRGVSVVEHGIAHGRGKVGRNHAKGKRERAVFPITAEHCDHGAVSEGRRGDTDPVGQPVQLRGLRVVEAHHDGIGSFHGGP